MLLFLSVLSFGGCNFLSGLIPHESKTETTLGNSNAIGEIKQNTAEEIYKIINEKKDYYLIDVRTKEEYSQGHLGGAALIPVDEIKNRLTEIPKDKPVIVYCKSGARSMQAANILVSNGFKTVYNMTGGIEEWQKEGYRLSKITARVRIPEVKIRAFLLYW